MKNFLKQYWFETIAFTLAVINLFLGVVEDNPAEEAVYFIVGFGLLIQQDLRMLGRTLNKKLDEAPQVINVYLSKGQDREDVTRAIERAIKESRGR